MRCDKFIKKALCAALSQKAQNYITKEVKMGCIYKAA